MNIVMSGSPQLSHKMGDGDAAVFHPNTNGSENGSLGGGDGDTIPAVQPINSAATTVSSTSSSSNIENDNDNNNNQQQEIRGDNPNTISHPLTPPPSTLPQQQQPPQSAPSEYLQQQHPQHQRQSRIHSQQQQQQQQQQLGSISGGGGGSGPPMSMPMMGLGPAMPSPQQQQQQLQSSNSFSPYHNNSNNRSPQSADPSSFPWTIGSTDGSFAIVNLMQRKQEIQERQQQLQQQQQQQQLGATTAAAAALPTDDPTIALSPTIAAKPEMGIENNNNNNNNNTNNIDAATVAAVTAAIGGATIGQSGEAAIATEAAAITNTASLIQMGRSLYHNKLFHQSSSSVEAVLAASCEVMGFDIAEMWLRTGPKTHQLTNSHLLPSAVEFLIHMSLSAAVTSVNALALDGLIDNNRGGISGGDGTYEKTILVDSNNNQLTTTTATATDGGNDGGTSRSEHGVRGSKGTSVGIYRPTQNNSAISYQRADKTSITGARLDLQWRQLLNVEYLTDGGNSWIHTAIFDGKPVVVKTLRPECQDTALAINEIEAEVAIHARLNHPNVVSVIGAGWTSKKVRFIVLERLDGGTLTQMLGYDTRIRDRRRRFWRKKSLPYLDVLRCARSLACALQYCHEQAIPGSMVLHRDLKPDNIGFTLDGKVKLIDFGLSRMLENADPTTNEKYEMSGETGSLRYMAPEVAEGLPYNHKADVYSFGIILWEMNAGKRPFNGLGRDTFYEQVVHGGGRPRLRTLFIDVLE
ncbi:kinase-like protein [Fragilariopsis cylindrus CCMP1102]|uniref:Kinase-like protein n=1 Tax=Fragilariopsis cylindrus CCMP1102 TaxID=635003 RepID=A0A1E7FU65_9STRA|nr:kinase-like protein [Fragilariopsis cylindrus CCMP1102]|eukprot:OEU21692.1 kinase-like protein [Fragilariopsis cylindrus CCMP1102]